MSRITQEEQAMVREESERLAALVVFLRTYGVLTLIIFGSLFVGFAVQTPLLVDEPKGAPNRLIWKASGAAASRVTSLPRLGCVLLPNRSPAVSVCEAPFALPVITILQIWHARTELTPHPLCLAPLSETRVDRVRPVRSAGRETASIGSSNASGAAGWPSRAG